MSEAAEAGLRLDEFPLKTVGVINRIDWDLLGEGARRLRELGFAEGVEVEPLHRGFIGRDPLACRIGRMTIAIRRVQAAAIRVSPTPA
ncbi:ferrous iron transport protein A [Sphingomonas jejuensis]|uniref:Ferrous iron transport protein A n=1 Tax=Sphingomonas jejuensis TaxID=904715 RepID=A0ABX0XNU4_9SPHN|nr:FeoA family protein [Sphingomonas jejuensis]NJC34905.1 ferrous iron transport protein A [Sphingomonas jejuensis]